MLTYRSVRPRPIAILLEAMKYMPRSSCNTAVIIIYRYQCCKDTHTHTHSHTHTQDPVTDTKARTQKSPAGTQKAFGFAAPPNMHDSCHSKGVKQSRPQPKLWYTSHVACLRHAATWHDYSGVHVTRLSLMAAIKAGVKIGILHVCTKTSRKSWNNFQLRIGPACCCQSVGAVWEDRMLQTHLAWDTAASNDGAFTCGSDYRMSHVTL